MPPEQGDEYRREIIWRLEQEKAQIDAENASFKASIDQRSADLDGQLRRAQSPLDDPALCDECWVFHADPHANMVPQPSGYGEDLLRCHRGHERRVSAR